MNEKPIKHLIITREPHWCQLRGRLFNGESLLKDIQSHYRQSIINEVELFLDGEMFIIEDKSDLDVSW